MGMRVLSVDCSAFFLAYGWLLFLVCKGHVLTKWTPFISHSIFFPYPKNGNWQKWQKGTIKTKPKKFPIQGRQNTGDRTQDSVTYMVIATLS